ncbi:MAG: hypothetical protein M1396_03935 [Chloroflexi bacterium]|nr:hypothetical protein [Chloroflexota bacterium]
MNDSVLVRCYENILEIAREQLAALRSADLGHFLALQKQRDLQFVTIARLTRNGMVPARFPAGSPVGTSLRDTLCALAEIDKQLMHLLSAEMAATGEEMKRLRSGKRALAGYGGSRLSYSLLLDVNR